MARGGSHADEAPDDGGVSDDRRVSAARLAPWQVKLAREEIALRIRDRLRVADVAAKLQLSATHFAKAFKNSVGDTPYRWYQRARIARSMQMLSDGNLSLAEIATECGFTDESHYITSFSRLVGITPGRWRRKKLAPEALDFEL